MNTVNSTRFQEQFVVALATVGLTAAVTLAAVGPDTMRSQHSSADVACLSDTKTPVPSAAAEPHFERSDEPAIEVDLVRPHGG